MMMMMKMMIRRRNGGTKLIFRIKEQEIRITLQEYCDDNDNVDDENPIKRWRDQLHLENQGTENTPNPSGT
jgi:hypothetical protein